MKVDRLLTPTQLIQDREALFGAERRQAEAQARLQQVRLKQWSSAGAPLSALGLDAAP
jgi:hypothetical protein